MSRARSSVIKISCDLQTTGPLRVGGLGESPDTQMPLARDGRNRLYVPGTSLAGPLRAWVERRFDPSTADALFGPREAGSASRFVVLDALVSRVAAATESTELQSQASSEAFPEVWDGVGIDRQWGAAARRVKYDYEVLPQGTFIAFRATLELPPEASDATRLEGVTGHMLTALVLGEIAVGGGKTRGAGRLRALTESGSSAPLIVLRREEWSTRSGVLAILQGGDGGATLSLEDLRKGATLSPSASRLGFRIVWKPRGPLMVRSAREAVAVDGLPFTSRTSDGRFSLTLPGSAIKGALRFQAERIVRTVLGTSAPDWSGADDEDQRHLAQIDVPIVRDLFGLAKKPTKVKASGGAAAPTTSAPPGAGTSDEARAGALSVATCYLAETSRLRLTRKQWRLVEQSPARNDRETTEGKDLRDVLEDAGLGHELQAAYHVSVDRWTGGAAARRLFAELEPMDADWQDIELDLDLGRIPEERRSAALVLLVLVLRDLALGRIPLGFGTNRGYGDLQILKVVVDGSDAGKWVFLGGEYELADDFAAGADADPDTDPEDVFGRMLAKISAKQGGE